MRTCTTAALAGFVASVAIGQQTWIVDPGGTGHFTDLGVAIAAASAGDTLLLRGGGNYTGAYLDKALALVAVPPQRPQIAVLGMSPTIGPPYCAVSGVSIDYTDVRAQTSFEDIEFLAQCNIDVGGAAVSLHRCQASAGIFVMSGHVLITECDVDGLPPQYLWPSPWNCANWSGGPAVAVAQGTVAITRCTLQGGGGLFTCPTYFPALPQPALIIDAGASARATLSTLSGGMSGSSPWPQAEAVRDQGSFFYDASVVFSPANSAGVPTFLPGTGGQSAAPGGTITCRAETGPNLAAVLVASLGLHGPVQWPQGVIWLDPNAFVVLRIGFTNVAGVMSATIPLPASAPRGLPITVQSGAAPWPGAGIFPGVPVALHVL